MNIEDNEIGLEIHAGGKWNHLGKVIRVGKEHLGEGARTRIEYDFNYIDANLEAMDYRSPSCAYPISFEPVECETWPAFLLDLFPQGAALKYVVDHHRISDRPSNYWQILKTAILSPPGNVRIYHPKRQTQKVCHPGFSRNEVVDKKEDFVEYMVQSGAPVSGTTGAGGASPKFLLREDHRGRFHAGGSLADADTAKFWLVKFPRERTKEDREILSAEKSFYQIAKTLGLKTHKPLEWDNDCLFIPRFDRELKNKRVFRFGLESFYSLTGIAKFGSRLEHETYLHALNTYSHAPEKDILEYIVRDLLSHMLGNTDNHGRNSSILKGKGWVRLSPLYDFAPMMFDRQGIARNTRWQNESKSGVVGGAFSYLEKQKIVEKEVYLDHFKNFFEQAKNIETLLIESGTPERIIDGTISRRNEVVAELKTALK